jgi:citrate synthase
VERSRADGVSLEDAARQTVREALASRRRLPGLGHRVHKIDPRTGVLFELARSGGLAGDGVAFIEALGVALEEAGKTLPINIDGALAAVLFDLGFDAAFGKLVFLIGRVAGLTAEVAEEYAREKPLRVRIPVTYDGHPPREID